MKTRREFIKLAMKVAVVAGVTAKFPTFAFSAKPTYSKATLPKATLPKVIKPKKGFNKIEVWHGDRFCELMSYEAPITPFQESQIRDYLVDKYDLKNALSLDYKDYGKSKVLTEEFSDITVKHTVFINP